MPISCRSYKSDEFQPYSVAWYKVDKDLLFVDECNEANRLQWATNHFAEARKVFQPRSSVNISLLTELSSHNGY